MLKFLCIVYAEIALGITEYYGPQFYSARNNDKCFLCDHDWESCRENNQFLPNRIDQTFDADNSAVLENNETALETGIDKLVCVGCYHLNMSPFENTVRKLSIKVMSNLQTMSYTHGIDVTTVSTSFRAIAIVLPICRVFGPIQSSTGRCPHRSPEFDTVDLVGFVREFTSIFANAIQERVQ